MIKRIASTQFQKAYPRLEEPHEVTVLGRVIGTWYPLGTGPSSGVSIGREEGELGTYSTKPFTPVPKKK